MGAGVELVFDVVVVGADDDGLCGIICSQLFLRFMKLLPEFEQLERKDKLVILKNGLIFDVNSLSKETPQLVLILVEYDFEAALKSKKVHNQVHIENYKSWQIM